MVLALLTVCSAVLLVWLLTQRYYQFYVRIPSNCTQKWPQPPATRLLGHAHLFKHVSSHLMLQRAHEIIAQYHRAGRLKVRLGCNFYFFIANPLDLQIIFSSPNFLEKSHEYAPFKPWLTQGMFISSAAKWARRRRLIKPAFHLSLLKDFIQIFDRNAKILVETLQGYAEKGTESKELGCDMLLEAGLCTLDIVCESTLGLQVDAQKRRTEDYVRAVQRVSLTINQKILNLFYRYFPFYYFTKMASKERHALKIIHKFSAEIIQRRRKHLLEQQQPDIEPESQQKNFLDLLLTSPEPLNEQEIQGEVDTVILGGFDTTATTISFLLYNLAKHPEYQQQCFEEVQQVYGDVLGPTVTYESLKRLHLLERCIRETLRMYPAAPLIVRRASENCNLNGFFVPANGNIIISPMFLGRHPSYFSKPDQFMPERFESLTVAKANSCSSPLNHKRLPNLLLIPFSAGQRNCVGQKYAMLELKVIMLHLLRHYKFSYIGNPNEELALSFQVTLHTQKPLLFRIEKRY